MAKTLAHVLKFLAAASLGLSAGAMLTAAMILVPFWQAVAPDEFLTWFAPNAQRMLYFFGPLQSAGVIFSVSAAIATFAGGASNRWLATVAAVLAIAVLLPFFIFFQAANASFAAATIKIEDVPSTLQQYAIWQWVRTGLGTSAFAVALLAIKE